MSDNLPTRISNCSRQSQQSCPIFVILATLPLAHAFAAITAGWLSDNQ